MGVVQPHQIGDAGGRAERAAGAGGVEAILVMAGRDRFGQLAANLDADMVGSGEIRARACLPFGHRQRRRQHRRGGVHQQPVYAVGGNGQLRVVEIMGVHGNGVGEGGKPRGQAQLRAQHRAVGFGETEIGKIGVDDMPTLRRRACQCQTEPVQDGFAPEFHHVCRNIARADGGDEVGDMMCQRRKSGGGVGHGGRSGRSGVLGIGLCQQALAAYQLVHAHARRRQFRVAQPQCVHDAAMLGIGTDHGAR